MRRAVVFCSLRFRTAPEAFGVSSLVGFFAAALGWLTLEVLGRPLRKFFDLRGETVELLTRVGTVRAEYKQRGSGDDSTTEVAHDLTPSEVEMLADARKDLRMLGPKFRAFALNETIALHAARTLRYDPLAAGQNLMALSNVTDRSARIDEATWVGC